MGMKRPPGKGVKVDYPAVKAKPAKQITAGHSARGIGKTKTWCGP